MTRRLLSLISLLSVSLGASAGLAQDEQAPPVETPIRQGIIVTADENGPVQALSLRATGGPDGNFTFMSTEPISGLGFGSPGMMSMLNDPQIQSELVLVDDQMEKIKELQREFQEQSRERMKELMGDGGQLDIAASRRIAEEMQSLRRDAEDRFRKVLLPHQLDRVNQIKYHMQMKNQSTIDVLTNGPLAEELGLSDQQKESLRKAAAEIEQDVKEEMRRIRAEAKEKLFGKLTPSQREKLEELIGDNFDYERPDFRRQIQRIRQRAEETRESADGNR